MKKIKNVRQFKIKIDGLNCVLSASIFISVELRCKYLSFESGKRPEYLIKYA